MRNFKQAGFALLLILSSLFVLADSEPAKALTQPFVPAESSNASGPVIAETEASPMLQEVTVSGIQPGPGLWKISKGSHAMWVLGTLNPLPKNMRWDSTMVQARVAQSQEVVLAPRVELDANIGFFGAMLLLPKALAAQKNPNKQQLENIVPSSLYARWLTQKAVYFKRNKSLEKKRPILAIDALYERALSRNGLKEQDWVSKVVRKAAKRSERTITVPQLKIKIDDPKQALAEFAASNLNDLPCFEQTLQRIESDLPSMKARANAWAVGDMKALAALPFQDQRQACANAFLTADMSKRRGLDDLQVRSRDAWMTAARAAIDTHERSFGVLRMSELLSNDGIAAQLREQGYTIEAPTTVRAATVPLASEVR